MKVSRNKRRKGKERKLTTTGRCPLAINESKHLQLEMILIAQNLADVPLKCKTRCTSKKEVRGCATTVAHMKRAAHDVYDSVT
jgi:hypothetical protein